MMTELKCSVIHCASNRDNHCCRPEIQVDGRHAQDSCDTYCGSFSVIRGGMTSAADYSHINHSMPISCTAELCVYNRERTCEANAIKVGGSGANTESQTECRTFRTH